MSKKSKKAIIILPTYNERDNIVKTIEVLEDEFRTIRHWQLGILVVDDTSPDKTYELVRNLQKKYQNLHLLLNRKKSGLGGAYLKGMAQAFDQLKATVVFEFDADLSHDVHKIGQFLEQIDAGAAMVIGSRYIPGGGIPADWGVHRKFLSVVGNKFINLMMLDFSLKDWTSGFRAITEKVYRQVVSQLGSERFSGYTFQIGFLYLARQAGFEVVEVPFVFKDRQHGHSKIGPEYIKNTLMFISKVRLNDLLTNRIFKFAMVGLVGASVQLSTLNIFRLFSSYQLAYFLSVEMAVLSNFILNNLWTFSDRKLKLKQFPIKFVHFNLASAGSIIIQQIFALIGQYTFGLKPLFRLPVVHFMFDTGTLYAIIGILLGMSWNFFAYNKFIWKKNKNKE